MVTIRLMSLLLILVWASGCGPEPAELTDRLPLKDNWQLQTSAKIAETGESLSSTDFNGDGWYETSVPATVLAALVENKVYPEPFYGLNLKSIPGFREGRWLAMPKDSPFYPSWWYRCEFLLPPRYEGRRMTLHFGGINYRANIWFNGRQLGTADEIIGMFRRFDFDITQWAKPGEANVVAIETIAPGKIPDRKYSTKQLEATTGWDDHNPQPPDLNMGLWQDVFISTSGAVTVEDPYVVTDLDLPSLEVAHLTISVNVINHGSREVNGVLKGQIESVEISQPVSLQPGETSRITFSAEEYPQLNLSQPRLWWPHPLGSQELYELQLEFLEGARISDRDRVTFGVREVSTYINQEGWRGYRINGKDILIRGGAWMTSDMLLRLTRRRYEGLIRYAREANLNMLRSEGFSVRETDEFYDLCDRYGVMVTQQIFGRSIPDEDLAIANVKDMLLRIRNHPSLVHFLGHDETFPTENLDHAYRQMIAEYTPERSYQPHSGAFDIENRFKTGGTRTGTRELWTYANPTHYYTHKVDGAWGFAQSGGIGGVVAPIESMRRMMPEEAIWPPFNETFSFHTVIQGVEYFRVLFEALDRRYGKPKNAEEFSLKGQVLNYESARGMFEAFGRNKFDALGITTWKYDAAWPAALTWQYVDWYLITGGAYYGAKKACEPLHVQYSYDDSSIYVVNAFYEPFNDLKVEARILNLDMEEKFSRAAVANVAENDKLHVFDIAWPEGLTKSHFLSLRLRDSAGEEVSRNLYWLSTVPDVEGEKGEREEEFFARPRSVADHTELMELPSVRLEMDSSIEDVAGEKVAVVELTNPTVNLAFFVHLAVTRDGDGSEVAPVYWMDNYFSMFPGEKRTVRGRFSMADLNGSAAVVKLDGWNVEPQ